LALDGAFTLGMAALGIRVPRESRKDPAQELFFEADQAALTLTKLLQTRKLKSSLHSAMATVANECATSWRRIDSVSQEKIWTRPEVAAQWTGPRGEWSRAADLAMAEALILCERSVTLRGPRTRVEEVLEDVIDTFVPAKRTSEKPLPIQFRELRLIAEKLQILSREVESISRTFSFEAPAEPQLNATQNLEEVLSKMREIRQAEVELHHGA
jgi:hypothetical protein